MKSVTTYLNFDRNCRQAMRFYQQCLGADMFWGARFGMLTDQFGVQWMFNYDLPQQT
jgi:uncharacterized glyoxalase superfamily protein PhnB